MNYWKPTVFWIVEDGVLVEYRRSGECKRCGQCCCGVTINYTEGMQFVSSEKGEEKQQDLEWSEYEGYSVFRAQGLWWYFRTNSIEENAEDRCEALSAEGQCEDWGDPERFKPICRYWPYHPKDLEHFPDCGFSFEKVESQDAVEMLEGEGEKCLGTLKLKEGTDE